MKTKSENKSELGELELALLKSNSLIQGGEEEILPTEACGCNNGCAASCRALCGEVDSLGKIIVYAVPLAVGQTASFAIAAAVGG